MTRANYYSIVSLNLLFFFFIYMKKQSLFGLSTPVDIEVHFTNEEQRKLMEVKIEKDTNENHPVFLDGETVSGKVKG